MRPQGLPKWTCSAYCPAMAISRPVHFPIPKETVEDGPQKHLKRGRGGQTGARQYRGGHIGVKPSYVAAQLDKTGHNAPDQGGCGVEVPGDGLQSLQVHHAQGITCGLDANLVGILDLDGGHRIQVDGGSQNMASLVIGMIGRRFPPARGQRKSVWHGQQRLPGSRRPALPGGWGIRLEAAFHRLSWNYLQGGTGCPQISSYYILHCRKMEAPK